jgi:hypothetical protein
MAIQKMPTLSFRGQANVTIDFAFGELRSYLGRTPQLHNLKAIQLAVEPATRDAYEFRVDKNNLQIIGANERSCLYGAYGLLEAVGWRFPAPGEERFEQTSFRAASWRQLTGKTEASFQYRGLSVVTYSVEEVSAVVDWMGKQRLNSIFLGHKGDGAQINSLLTDLEHRAIRVEAGGHILDEFLPLELFAQKPELFRIQNGQRRQDGNFCTNNPETLAIITENAVKFARALPSAQFFHFWAEDVTGGSWCECDGCRALSPTEQMLRAINAVADGIAQERPSAIVDMILYHDTLDFPETLQPRPNVFAFYAPRERCYAHGIGDASCPHNAWYASRLVAARQAFGSRLSVFEYYCDWILWRCLGVAVPTTIVADLAWYKSMGVDQIEALHFGAFSNWAYALNAFAFARASWDVTQKRDALATQFCHARYGEHARSMLQTYFSFEQASVHALTYDGYGKDAYDIRDTPAEPAEFAQKHIALVEQAVTQTETAITKLPEARHKLIGGERQLLELNRDNLRALLHQMRGRQFEASSDPDCAAKMGAEYDAAIALLQSLQSRLAETSREHTGAWGESAPNQFKMIAELLQSAKAGNRKREW